MPSKFKRVQAIVRKKLSEIRIGWTVSELNPGGKLVTIDAKPVEAEQPLAISKDQSFFSRVNNLMKADFGNGPIVEGSVLYDKQKIVAWKECIDYEETAETLNEDWNNQQKPTYKEVYAKIAEQEVNIKLAQTINEAQFRNDDHLYAIDKDIVFEDDVKLLEKREDYAKPTYPVNNTLVLTLGEDVSVRVEHLKGVIKDTLGIKETNGHSD